MGRASVIDGDTIEVHGQRIRLWGVDAPEGQQRCTRDGRPWRCGTDAANALDRYISGQTIACVQRDRDRYGRVVAVCKVAGDDFGGLLVRHGWALDYPRYSGGTYANHQSQARSERRGMWQGEFEAPWEWRRRKTPIGRNALAVINEETDGRSVFECLSISAAETKNAHVLTHYNPSRLWP